MMSCCVLLFVVFLCLCFFFKQKTAYEMRISDWSSDVCSSDLVAGGALLARRLSVPLLVGGLAGGVGLAWLALTGDLLTAMLAIGVAVAGLLLLDEIGRASCRERVCQYV